jgi:acyl-CoA synthetase (AMP-forming)/AMP-acid ligase II
VPLGLLLEMAADTWPDRVVVGRAGSAMTAEEVRAASANGAALILRSGARTVAFLDVNGPGFVVALWSAARAGVPFCPLNYRMAAEQLESLLGTLDAPLVIGGPDHRDLLGSAAADFLGTADFLAAVGGPATDEPAPVDDESRAILLFTSGTTSTPKAVVLSHENLVSYVLESVEFGSAGEDEAILVCMPPYHVAGVNGALTNLFSGRRVVHLPNFSPQEWLRLVREEAITHAMVVPTMLARIVEQLDGAVAEAPALQNLAYGGARMPRPVLERALVAFPEAGFVNAYGLTETSSTVAVLGPEDHRAAATARDAATRDRLGSVGRLLPGIEAEIRDELGAVVRPGEVGELWLRGRQISGGYRGVGSVLDEQGWFPTRDRARMDDEGYLFIEGRSDDTIIRGGENIAPAEIEDVLGSHPAVADTAVVGRPDDEWGERIVAAVVLRPGAALDEEGVRAFVRTHLRSSRTPDDVVFVRELPYTPTGKLVRRELVARLTADTLVR